MKSRTDGRAGSWLAGVVMGAVSGLAMLIAGFPGVMILIAAGLLIVINGPRRLAAAGIVTGASLVWSVLFAMNALTCGGPLDPGTSTCTAPDLRGWIVATTVIFAVGLVASAIALSRTDR